MVFRSFRLAGSVFFVAVFERALRFRQDPRGQLRSLPYFKGIGAKESRFNIRNKQKQAPFASVKHLYIRMLSFLFIDTERVWRGGQDQLFTLLTGLHRRGHKIHLVCQPCSLLEERARNIGISVHQMAIRSEVGLLSLFRLMALLRQIRPQILAFNTPRAVIAGNLASRFSAVRARIIFRRVSFPLRNNPLTRMKYRLGIDCIVAISESIRSQLLARGIPPGLIRIIYEGMDLGHYPKRDSPVVRPGEAVVIGTIAHLSSEKGINHLIEAAALIPDVSSRMRFVVVGEGSLRHELEQQVRTANLESCFRFAGFQKNTGDYLATFDIFVLPSLSEGLSSSILSAMASSLPVVATQVGGIPELVRHGDNGLLVPAADPPALAQALQCLAENPSERFRMGQRGRARMESEFTLERKVAETERLCYSLLQDR